MSLELVKYSVYQLERQTAEEWESYTNSQIDRHKLLLVVLAENIVELED